MTKVRQMAKKLKRKEGHEIMHVEFGPVIEGKDAEMLTELIRAGEFEKANAFLMFSDLLSFAHLLSKTRK